jgi:hypothetical protein
MKFSDFTGRELYHCRILENEDPGRVREGLKGVRPCFSVSLERYRLEESVALRVLPPQ